MTTKTRISQEQIRSLGELARLNLTSSEEKRLEEELSSILSYFDVLDELKPPGSGEDDGLDGPRGGQNAHLRPDDVRPSDPEGVLKGVPHRKGRLVKAPRVF